MSLLLLQSRVKRAAQEGDFHQKPTSATGQAEAGEGLLVPSPRRDRLTRDPKVQVEVLALMCSYLTGTTQRMGCKALDCNSPLAMPENPSAWL